MLDRGVAEGVDGTPNDVDFHRWVLHRNRSRATHLIWVLVTLLIASLAVVAVLMTERDQETVTQGATSQELAALEQRFEELDQRFREVAVNLRTTDRRAARLTSCLENRIVKVTTGIHALLADRISLRAYLRRYNPVGCP